MNYIYLIFKGVWYPCFFFFFDKRIEFSFSCTVYAVRSSGIRVSVRLYLNERRSTCECFNVCCCFTVKIQFGCARLTSGRIVGVVVAALPASLSTQSACDKRLRKTEFRSSKGRRKK